MRTLYPAIKPYTTHALATDAPHVLYIEECGNPEGIPAVFLHGGPGGGSQKLDRSFFNPEIYRIIVFDQRGCGRSRPHGSLESNHTRALVDDLEAMRSFLGIDRWLVFGGSWGSTLGLVYAETHPARVLGLVLRGIFLGRPEDIRWFYQDGANRIFPEYWRDFLAPVSGAEGDDLLNAYYRKLTGSNELERMFAAKAWSTWEGRCATLNCQQSVVDSFAAPRRALALARLEAHFMINQVFMAPNQILANSQHLAGIPGHIIHGRYDMICPVDQALALSDAWPEATLEIVRDAGHIASEPGITDALIRATDAMAARLSST